VAQAHLNEVEEFPRYSSDMVMCCLYLCRLPRFCRTGAITALSRNEFRVFQALTDHATKRLDESTLIIVFAFVEPERLLIAVTEQMKRFNVYICAFKLAFQKRPKVF